MSQSQPEGLATSPKAHSRMTYRHYSVKLFSEFNIFNDILLMLQREIILVCFHIENATNASWQNIQA